MIATQLVNDLNKNLARVATVEGSKLEGSQSKRLEVRAKAGSRSTT